jgi:hypothetical protein
VVRLAGAHALSHASVDGMQQQRSQDIILGIQAAEAQYVVAALVGESSAGDVSAVARSTAKRALSVPLLTVPQVYSVGNSSGGVNCTAPWTGPEIDDYQVFVWVVVLLVALVVGAFICLAGSLGGNGDPVLYSAFQASDFHAHAE